MSDFFPALCGPFCHLEWCNLYHSSGSAITLSIAVDSISLSFKWIQLDSSSQANSTNDAIPHAASPKEISSLKSGPFISWYKQDTYKPTLLFSCFDSQPFSSGWWWCEDPFFLLIIPLGVSIMGLNCFLRLDWMGHLWPCLFSKHKRHKNRCIFSFHSNACRNINRLLVCHEENSEALPKMTTGAPPN